MMRTATRVFLLVGGSLSLAALQQQLLQQMSGSGGNGAATWIDGENIREMRFEAFEH